MQKSETKLVKVDLPFIRVYPINSMNYNENLKMLCVSRTDSTIEIWAYPTWVLLERIHLDLNLILKKVYLLELNGRKVLCIVTANSYILMYDLQKGQIYQTLNHGGSFAWDSDFFKFQYLENEKGMAEEDLEGYLVLACNDGASRLYTMDSYGKLSLKRSTPSHDTPCMAVTFSSDGAHYYMGNGDCNVRKYQVSNGKNKLTINSGGETQGERIWSIKYIEPYFLVIGYSSGKVKFFEASFGSLIKEFKDHNGDVLSLLVSKDQKRIFATGADSKITCYNKNVEDIEGLERIDFEFSSSDRGQSHDIYSLVELHDDLILSAGLSTDICLYKIQGNKFRERRQGTQNKIKLRHITYKIEDW